MNIETVGNSTEASKAVHPFMKRWELYFDESCGYENRTVIAKAFTEFWNDPKADKIEIPGKCMLGGKVYGRKGFRDGVEVFTSNVKVIERIKRDRRDGVPHDLMCATTASGSRYYIYSDGHNAYMAMMLGDIIHAGSLSKRQGHYLKPLFHDKKLI